MPSLRSSYPDVLQQMQHIKKKDLILLLAVSVLIAGGFLVKSLFFGKEGIKARIAQPGGIITELDLNKETELHLDDGLGGTNTVVVKDGKLSVTEANCPDLVCVYSPPVSLTGEIIACLPHGLVITVMEPEK